MKISLSDEVRLIDSFKEWSGGIPSECLPEDIETFLKCTLSSEFDRLEAESILKAHYFEYDLDDDVAEMIALRKNYKE